jgi:endonuclease-3
MGKTTSKVGDQKEILRIMNKTYPKPKIALNFGGVWQLLVVVILSAQCTDKRVNIVSPAKV